MSSFLSLVAFQLEGGRGPGPPDYAYCLMITVQVYSHTGADLGGDASPPTSVKLTVSAEKITLNFVEDLFFFFFFGEHLILGGKNVRIFDFGRKITLNFGEDIRIFEGLCLKSPPPKFSRSATALISSIKFVITKLLNNIYRYRNTKL